MTYTESRLIYWEFPLLQKRISITVSSIHIPMVIGFGCWRSIPCSFAIFFILSCQTWNSIQERTLVILHHVGDSLVTFNFFSRIMSVLHDNFNITTEIRVPFFLLLIKPSLTSRYLRKSVWIWLVKSSILLRCTFALDERSRQERHLTFLKFRLHFLFSYHLNRCR